MASLNDMVDIVNNTPVKIPHCPLGGTEHIDQKAELKHALPGVNLMLVRVQGTQAVEGQAYLKVAAKRNMGRERRPYEARKGLLDEPPY
jgi:hypothetical protein